MASKVILFVLGLLVAWAAASDLTIPALPKNYVEDHNQIRLCGRHLGDAVELICRPETMYKRNYKKVSPLLWKHPNMHYDMDYNDIEEAGPLDLYLGSRIMPSHYDTRMKRFQEQPGLSDLCCLQTCDIETIKTFCQF